MERIFNESVGKVMIREFDKRTTKIMNKHHKKLNTFMEQMKSYKPVKR